MLHKGVYGIKGDGSNRVSKISSRLGLEMQMESKEVTPLTPRSLIKT
jgi:hypothetical protein